MVEVIEVSVQTLNFRDARLGLDFVRFSPVLHIPVPQACEKTDANLGVLHIVQCKPKR